MTANTPLTAREMDVLRLIARGYDNRSIACELGVSNASIEKHSARIFRKIGVRLTSGRNSRVLATLWFHGLWAAAPQGSGD